MIVFPTPQLPPTHFPEQARGVEDLDGIMSCVMWRCARLVRSSGRIDDERGDGRTRGGAVRSLDHGGTTGDC